jgi:hypothetical protein
MVTQPHCLDSRVAIKDCPGDTMHTVHDPPICSQDGRKRKVNFLDESNMVNDPSNSWGRAELEPEVSVNIGDRSQAGSHVTNRKVLQGVVVGVGRD